MRTWCRSPRHAGTAPRLDKVKLGAPAYAKVRELEGRPVVGIVDGWGLLLRWGRVRPITLGRVRLGVRRDRRAGGTVVRGVIAIRRCRRPGVRVRGSSASRRSKAARTSARSSSSTSASATGPPPDPSPPSPLSTGDAPGTTPPAARLGTDSDRKLKNPEAPTPLPLGTRQDGCRGTAPPALHRG